MSHYLNTSAVSWFARKAKSIDLQTFSLNDNLF